MIKDNYILTDTLENQIPTLLQKNIFQSAPASELIHAPLTSQRAYYRSKFNTANIGINPLVTAANTLIAFIANFHNLTTIPDSYTLYQDLTHEIKAFEAAAQKHYRSESLLVARYILCAALDEIILTSPWNVQNQWNQYKLLTTFHNEEWGGERFFLILERLNADPVHHIDLLELIYICLNLGYKGKFQFMDNNTKELNNVFEKLYESIRWQRGDIKRELGLDTEIQLAAPKSKAPIPLSLVSSFTAIILLSLYTIFNFMLGSYVTPLYQQLNSIL